MLDLNNSNPAMYDVTSDTVMANTLQVDTTKKAIGSEGQMKTTELNMDTNERQQKYVQKQKNHSGAGLGVVFQDAFIRGMRDIGYKNPAWAIAEIIDNAIQASAQRVEIRFGFGNQNKSQAKNPEAIAIIDDGAGMIPEMISYAVRWGGTDREDDRNGFGRFGYGLPSAAVSIACRYTVYSKTKENGWHAVTIDLQELAAASNDATKTENLLSSKAAELPSWLATFENGINVNDLASGTIVVLENLDRLNKNKGWIQVLSLKSKLLDHFGLIYRHWIPDVQLIVDGKLCDSVDPLFLLPHALHYDETPVMAKRVHASSFEMDAPNGEKSMVRIRASILPPQFIWATPEDLTTRKNKNKRWAKVVNPKNKLNGLIICREGRQIDVVQPEWTKFQNYDGYIKIEVDFDPALDELFGVTTSKQQIVIEDSIWEKLKTNGNGAGNLVNLVREMRSEWDLLNDSLQAQLDSLATKSEDKLPSAEAMIAAEKLKSKTTHLTDEKREEAQKNLNAKIQEEIKATGRPLEEVKQELEESIARRPWDIDFQALDEGPFYQPKRLGTQKRIVINTAHPFYSHLYNQADNVRSAIEVMLFVLADGEIDAEGQRSQFYKSERNNWTQMLSTALESLESNDEIKDREASKLETIDSEQSNI